MYDSSGKLTEIWVTKGPPKAGGRGRAAEL
jgi:hypothetical protein